MIPFYVQARKIAIQTIFGDISTDKNISLEHLYVSADKLAVICLRIFERFIPDRSLSTSAGNVIKSLNPLSFNSTDEISVLDFMHFCLVEYQRLQLKAFHDEEVMQKQRKRKIDDIKVPPIDQMFYKDPSIIIKNFDYDHAEYVPVAPYQTNRTANTTFGEIDEGLLRIAAPTSKFQNNPPKTVEEKRKLREKADDDETVVKTAAPQKAKLLSTKNIKKDDQEPNEWDADFQVTNNIKIIGGSKARKDPNIFAQDDKLDAPTYKNDAPSQLKLTENRAKISNQERAKLTPIKGSNINLGVPGVFINNSEAGHTSSHRSLYSYGSRNNDIISASQADIVPETQPSRPDEKQQEDFSGFLSWAAQNKPSFLNKTKKHRQLDSNYENAYNKVANAPDLPPRDYGNPAEPTTK